jgi:hypothetical protein
MSIAGGIIETEEIPGIRFRERRVFLACFDDEGHNMPKGNRQTKKDALDFAEFLMAHIGPKTQDQLIIRPPFKILGGN